MKNLLFFTLTFLVSLTVVSQSCLPEGITFTTQAEIDSFQINYPYCTDIEGDLWIHGNTITNLDGLNDLTSIGGKLKITSNSTLTSLTGLNNVSYIGGNLEMYYNNALASLSGLENVTTIGGGIQISYSIGLTNLSENYVMC